MLKKHQLVLTTALHNVEELKEKTCEWHVKQLGLPETAICIILIQSADRMFILLFCRCKQMWSTCDRIPKPTCKWPRANRDKELELGFIQSVSESVFHPEETRAVRWRWKWKWGVHRKLELLLPVLLLLQQWQPLPAWVIHKLHPSSASTPTLSSTVLM